jgi:hypothetical protein
VNLPNIASVVGERYPGSQAPAIGKILPGAASYSLDGAKRNPGSRGNLLAIGILRDRTRIPLRSIRATARSQRILAEYLKRRRETKIREGMHPLRSNPRRPGTMPGPSARDGIHESNSSAALVGERSGTGTYPNPIRSPSSRHDAGTQCQGRYPAG